jgi:hypothetical protein
MQKPANVTSTVDTQILPVQGHQIWFGVHAAMAFVAAVLVALVIVAAEFSLAPTQSLSAVAASDALAGFEYAIALP